MDSTFPREVHGRLQAIGWALASLFFATWGVFALLRAISLHRVDIQILKTAKAEQLPLLLSAASLLSIGFAIYSLRKAIRKWVRWRESRP
jgi:hypothetical protein